MLYFKHKKPSSYDNLGFEVKDLWHMGELVEQVARKMPHTAIGKFYEEMATWNSMGALDAEDFEKFVSGTGEKLGLRLVAIMPPQVAYMLHENIPGFMGENKNEFYKWLARPENAMYRSQKR